MTAKYLDPRRIEDILTAATVTPEHGPSRRMVGNADVQQLAALISKELGSVPAVEPIFAMVECDPDGTPRLNSIDELGVADLSWFENVPPSIQALMAAMETDEVCVIKGQFHNHVGEWDTHQLIKRVL